MRGKLHATARWPSLVILEFYKSLNAIHVRLTLKHAIADHDFKVSIITPRKLISE